jgi:lipopolysaccharide transport system permease protein/teichoic acid transport system permease protein
MKRYLHEVYKRKDLLLYLVTSGLKAQHRNTFLGYFWWLLDPLLGVLIYYFVVVVVFHRGGDDYGMFLVIGMVVWGWLSSTVSVAAKSIVAQAGIITQVYLPKVMFPVGVTLSQLINFGFGLCVIALFFIFFGLIPGSAVLWLPYIMLMQLLFMLAIASLCAYVCVFVRDIDSLVSHLLRLWFFGSPVIWREELVPEGHRWLLEINPMTHFLASYRGVLMANVNPDYVTLFSIGSISIIALLFMTYFYSQHEHKIIKAL